MIGSLLFVLTALSAGSGDAPVHPSHLLIKPRSGANARDVAAAHAAAHARVLRDLPQIGWQIVEVPPLLLEESRAAYLADPVIERADFDRARKLAYTPNDPMWPMWHMQKIRADLAWDTHKGAPSVVVAVMDTGMNTTHPDIAANVWTNAGEIAGNSIDDDLNGYVDDVHGYDFAYGDSNPDDQNGHGTSCAGIIAAVQDNNIGVTGVAPLCKVAAVKAALDSGYFYDSANVPALVYCADMGFKVVSMSFYSDGVTPAERDAIDYCWTHDVLPVAAAGNDQSVLPYYPGAYDNVVSVAATNSSDIKSSFSNWGTWVDVAAPGQSLSTISGASGYTTGFAGTSGACPHVAGLAGLLVAAAPSAGNAAIRAALEDGCITLNQAPYGQYTGYGRIDAYNALQRVLGTLSGSKPARLLCITPVGGSPEPASPSTLSPFTNIRFYGVGFESPHVVRVLRNGVPQTLLAHTRNLVEVAPSGNQACTYVFELDGNTLNTLNFTAGSGWTYSATEASTLGSGGPVASGGFAELLKDDGQLFTCTRRSDGTVFVELAVRKILVESKVSLDIDFTRAWTDCNGGVETIALYDWSTASYPYGSFVNVSSTGIANSSSSTLHVNIPSNVARFVDDEGTIYVHITATNAGSLGKLSADSFRVTVHTGALSPTTTYCTAQTNSQGCSPAMSFQGNASATSAAPFLLEAASVLNNKNGLLFFGTNGRNNGAFHGGTLCVAQPLRRTPLQFSGGNAGADDCSGTFSYNFNALIQSGLHPDLVPGAVVDTQYWSRDPGSPSTTNLTNAVEFEIDY